jgi:hypothetical protein
MLIGEQARIRPSAHSYQAGAGSHLAIGVCFRVAAAVDADRGLHDAV